MPNPTLIAVVGPVEPALLDAFITHYQELGIERFALALHFPLPTPTEVKADLHQVCLNRIGQPEVIVEEPWHESASDPIRNELRRRTGEGWHLLADADEFQCYPESVAATIDEAEAAGMPVAGGVLLDRVSADGTTRSWSPESGLDETYPLGAFLTHTLLRGDPRKIVLVHSRVTDVTTGNHRTPGWRPVNRPRVAIHHFKWRSGVLEYLRQRLEMLTTGEWRELSPAPRLEAQRFFAHIDAHGGRFGVDDPELSFRPVTVRELPSWWAGESQHLAETWRPPQPVASRPV